MASDIARNWTPAQVIQIGLPMVEALVTADGTTDSRLLVLIRLERDGIEGWGECVALPDDVYDGESSDEGFDQLASFFAGERDLGSLNRSASYAVDLALTDLDLRSRGKSLNTDIGVVVPSAVVGLGSIEETIELVEQQKKAGYQNFKLKVTPERVDHVVTAASAVSDCEFRLDANGSFDWSNNAHRKGLQKLASAGFTSIEQPFAVDHESDGLYLEPLGLLPTLDESVADLAAAIRLRERGEHSFVIKPYRFRSLANLRTFTEEHGSGTRFSIGGMIDGPLSRAANLALAATAPFEAQPAEIAVDGRWFARSYSSTTVTIESGAIAVPTGPGLGVVVDRDAVDDMTLRSMTF